MGSARDEHAVVWKYGELTDLATALDDLSPGWTMISAVGITKDGTIVVNATHAGTGYHALLLTPVAQ